MHHGIYEIPPFGRAVENGEKFHMFWEEETAKLLPNINARQFISCPTEK